MKEYHLNMRVSSWNQKFRSFGFTYRTRRARMSYSCVIPYTRIDVRVYALRRFVKTERRELVKFVKIIK